MNGSWMPVANASNVATHGCANTRDLASERSSSMNRSNILLFS